MGRFMEGERSDKLMSVAHVEPQTGCSINWDQEITLYRIRFIESKNLILVHEKYGTKCEDWILLYKMN